MKTLKAPKAAANFSRVLTAVHSPREPLEIVRKGVPCAYLVPPVERGSASREFLFSNGEVRLNLRKRANVPILIFTVGVLSVVAAVNSSCGADQPKTGAQIGYINPDAAEARPPAYKGRSYGRQVPDTLDLQERASLALGSLVGQTDANADCEIYWKTTVDKNPARMSHDWNDVCGSKWVEALPLLRLMSGSNVGGEVEQAWMQAVLKMQGDDGLLYFPTAGRPWWSAGCPSLPPGDQYTVIFADGRFLNAVSIYYLITKDPLWKEAGKRLVDGLAALVIDKGDKAYFDWIIYGPGRKTNKQVQLGAMDSSFSAENAKGERYVKNDPASILHNMGTWTMTAADGAVNYYRATGYKPALTLAGKLCKHTMENRTIFDAEARFLNEPGVPMAHFHGHLTSVISMLDYGIEARDKPMIDFCCKAYEYAKAHGNPLVGYFPEWVQGATSETCELADMIAIALKFSRSGVADRWDDADRWIRNQFAEQQLLRADWPDKAAENAPAGAVGAWSSSEGLGRKLVGCFSYTSSGNEWWTAGYWTIACCNGNGSRTLYYAWENILNYKNGRLSINLLLNRASPWADLDSYIPYEGRAVLTMKTSCSVRVRIPEWVTPDQAQCSVDGKSRSLAWDGRYAVVGKVKAGQKVDLSFPIRERIEKTVINGVDYTATIKGNTVVAMDPPGKRFPIYQRERFRDSKVHWKTTELFVPGTLLDWW